MTNVPDSLFGKFTPVIVFNRYEFEKLLSKNLYIVIDDLEILRKAAQEFSGYNWDNSQFKFENVYGDIFSFLLYETNKCYYFSAWNTSGQESLISITTENECFSKSEIQDIMLVSERYTQGQIDCSHCGIIINREEARKAGRTYFAGIYCPDCWNNEGFAYQAAHENYE